jgi:hypothetical protein
VTKGRGVLWKFPFRVAEGKHEDWLRLIRVVEAEVPGLHKWGSTGTAHKDIFLDWIEAEMKNPEGAFHTRLAECLVEVIHDP